MLAGIVINSGMDAYKDSKLMQYVARMNMVQSKVNVAYAEIKAENKRVEDYGISADTTNGDIRNNYYKNLKIINKKEGINNE